MSREKNPEIRSNPDLPLFAEQSFTKFEQQKSGRTETLPGAGENGDCRSLRDAQSSSSSPRDVARARRTDGETSHAAARSVVNIGPTRELILLILRKCGPQQDQDIIEYFQNTARNDRDWEHLRRTTEQSIRTRRKELVRMDLVEACGTGKTASGRDCTIWRLTPMGEQK